jgi:hypothetical protein
MTGRRAGLAYGSNTVTTCALWRRFLSAVQAFVRKGLKIRVIPNGPG